MMNPKNFYRIMRIKKYIEIIAYGSLIVDFAITLVTLYSLNTRVQNFSTIQTWLNYALSGIMILTIILFAALVVLSHYERIIDRLASMGLNIRSKKRRRAEREAHLDI